MTKSKLTEYQIAKLLEASEMAAFFYEHLGVDLLQFKSLDDYHVALQKKMDDDWLKETLKHPELPYKVKQMLETELEMRGNVQ